MNITLHYIPAGQTDKYQPLDRKVFGVLKAKSRSLIRRKLSENPDQPIKKKDAVADLIACWDSLTQDTILDSWDIYTK